METRSQLQVEDSATECDLREGNDPRIEDALAALCIFWKNGELYSMWSNKTI